MTDTFDPYPSMTEDPHASPVMEEEEYAKMADHDDSMWWYRALHRNMAFLLRRALAKRPADVLDAGCGTGGLLKFLSTEEPECRLHGTEFFAPACKIAETRSGVSVVCGSINDLPFPNDTFDAILVTDVLSQKGVDPAQAAREAYRCLRPGGVFALSEVAFNWLQSYHDRRVGVERRFSRAEIREILLKAGFKLKYASYWNFFFFPLVVLRRKVFSSEDTESDVREYPRAVEAIFRGVMSVEHAILATGLRLPFGVSVMAAGVKTNDGE